MPPCGGDSFDWEAAVPRIVNPTKVKIIELLRTEGRPLSATRIKRLLGDPGLSVNRVAYHCESLREAGVLIDGPRPADGAHNERFYCLAPP